MSKKPKQPTTPATGKRDAKDLEALVLGVVELLQDANSTEDRRNFIMRLQGQAVPISEIEKITLRAFGITKKTLNDDLLWIQDYWDSYTDPGSSRARKQEILAYNAEILRRALSSGDLDTAQRANQHRAALLRAR
jgi:hypothetical protein